MRVYEIFKYHFENFVNQDFRFGVLPIELDEDDETDEENEGSAARETLARISS